MLTEKDSLYHWLTKNIQNSEIKISKLAGDASSRRYYRVNYKDQSRILMDSSEDRDSFIAFIQTTNLFTQYKIPVPAIYNFNQNLACALIEDFGDNSLFSSVEVALNKQLYQRAIDLLIKINNLHFEETALPIFDENFIYQQLQLMEKWFVEQYLKLKFTAAEKLVFKDVYKLIVNCLKSQPRSITLMDYHSRNIMVAYKLNDLGVIDYQDARIGPYTYDLVSLLKDCYVKLPADQIDYWLNYFYKNTHLSSVINFGEFHQAFDWCGLQRHLKVLGIFSRLFLRDGKQNYLKDLPLTLSYILNCAQKYPPLANFHLIMQTKVLPVLSI
jgi:N-acetylmuramate 1-kinase